MRRNISRRTKTYTEMRLTVVVARAQCSEFVGITAPEESVTTPEITPRPVARALAETFEKQNQTIAMVSASKGLLHSRFSVAPML
jgi:hypothetical protein